MTPEHDGQTTAGRRFRTFFTAACIDTREQAGAKEGRVASEMGVRDISVIRFERGETFPSNNLELYAVGYAAVSKTHQDPRDIFKRAVEWWIQAGLEPLIESSGAEPSPKDVVAAIRAAEEAHQERDRAAARPSATRKNRKAAG